MARWEVRTRSGGVQVEAGNWLLAVGTALPSLGLEVAVLARLVCDVQADGVVRIIDPVSRTPLLVRQLAEPALGGARPVSPTAVVVSSASPAEEETSRSYPAGAIDLGGHITLDEIDITAPPPPAIRLAKPAPPPPLPAPRSPAPPAEDDRPPALSTLDLGTLPPGAPPAPAVRAILPELPATRPAQFSAADMATLDDIDFPPPPRRGAPTPPPDLEERLYMDSMDIRDAESPEAAASAALDALTRLVDCEASSVLYASINDTALRFLAARGPSAHEVAGLTVPFGHGIAGFCYDTGASLVIRNASQDPRHLHRIDEKTGFHTQDLLSVPLRDEQGRIHGCLQLLNAPGGFADWQLTLANRVAGTLAERLSVET